ncbi:MAG: gliding motility-associated C-terminal domain-containing protein [Bacteroidales bacterium]
MGDSITLNAGSGYISYQWQNGTQDSTLIATSPGWYWVIVSGPGGCTSVDSIYVDTYPPIPIDLGNDTLMCEFNSFTIDAGPGFLNYVWQDSVVGQTYLVTNTGTYWVTVTNDIGCTATDSIYVGISPAVNVSLGADTTICSGDNFSLSPGNEFVSYEWQNGSTGSFINITSAGTYWVHVTDINDCSGSDTVNIAMNPSPQLDLGADTIICEGQELFLDPGLFSTYVWQDNSTQPFYNVTSTGIYSLTVTNNFNCDATDDIFVEVSSPNINLGPDTLVCEGSTIILDAGPNFSSYLWHDNSDQQYNTVDTAGFYFVNVINDIGCEGGDSIFIDYAPLPVANLGTDKELCEGDTITLISNAGPYTYLWNGEIGGYQNEITEGGTYTLEVSNQCGSETDQITIVEFQRRDVNLGADQILKPGESIDLNAGTGYDSYLWQDGSFNQYYHVIAESIDPDHPYYYVEVVEGPCKSSDTIRIELFEIKVPIAITPNGDGANDVFKPFEDTWNGINQHHIMVFNRWGEQVWESEKFEEGWDGKRNGKYVSDGTYFWILDVFYGPQDIKQTLRGTLTVMGQ